MNDVSVGQGGQKDDNETHAEKDKTLNKTFGEEGTNKTQAVPDPKATRSEIPGTGKHMDSSPFVR